MTSPLEINKLENAAIGRAIASLSAFDATQQSFVDFTTKLLHDVFKVLLDATLEQLEAYADLVASVAGSLEAFETRMVGDQTVFEQRAADYIKDVVIPSFSPSGFGDNITPPITATNPADIEFDPDKIDSAKAAYGGVVIVQGNTENEFSTLYNATTHKMPTSDLIALTVAKLKQDVKGSYDKLVTILKIGMQKLVVTEGEVRTSLTWHVDAADTDEMTSNTTDTTFDENVRHWNVSRAVTKNRTFGGSLFGMTFGRTRGAVTTMGADGSRTQTHLRVSVVNEKKTAVTHLNIDITGSVMVRFKSETFPPIDPTTTVAA
jgi:hypothetical protein